jgi:hypothetical protein
MPLAVFAAVGIAAFGIRSRDLWYLLLLFVPALAFLTSLLVISDKYIPYVRIELSTREGWLWYQTLFLIIATLTLLATIARVAVAVIAILSSDGS